MIRKLRVLIFLALLILGLGFPGISRCEEEAKLVLIESLEFRGGYQGYPSPTGQAI